MVYFSPSALFHWYSHTAFAAFTDQSASSGLKSSGLRSDHGHGVSAKLPSNAVICTCSFSGHLSSASGEMLLSLIDNSLNISIDISDSDTQVTHKYAIQFTQLQVTVEGKSES